jgi:hypothetical protein
MVISPEHPLIGQYADKISNLDEVLAYQEEAVRKSDFERTELVKEKPACCSKASAPSIRSAKKKYPSNIRLCADDVRHGRHYGRARARSARL